MGNPAKMKLASADWQELLPVFHETYKIWSPGLTKADYLEYQIRQTNHPWARRNIRHLTLSNDANIVSSLKLSSISLRVRGEEYRVGGIGAVYTQLACRNRGYANELLEKTIELARKEKYQALILFSDIDCGFYARYGFQEIGAADLLIQLPILKGKPAFPPAIKVKEDGAITISLDGIDYELRQQRLLPEHLDYATRHYQQWLRRQPYGIARDQQYFGYKLMRESFLHEHSHLSWPAISITTVTANNAPAGYAITESAGSVLRILEIVAQANVREAIWAALLVRAINEKLMRIRAWESLAADFAPVFNLQQLIIKFGLNELLPANFKGQLNYYNRSWGRGMLLPLTERLEDLHLSAPCPLVELDHL